jgi:hypothetical protein
MPPPVPAGFHEKVEAHDNEDHRHEVRLQRQRGQIDPQVKIRDRDGARIPARRSGARRIGARMKTATTPPASVPRKTGPAVSGGRFNAAGITRPSPNPMRTHAGTRYTYCPAPTHQAAANAMPRATKRYAPAFGTPSGGSRKAPPIARRTAPPRTPRRDGRGRSPTHRGARPRRGAAHRRPGGARRT